MSSQLHRAGPRSKCRHDDTALIKVLQGLVVPLRSARSPDRETAEVTADAFRVKEPPEILGSGHVVRRLGAALSTFHDADHFYRAVLRAVNLGDDSVTTKAVCGQSAGAYGGQKGIPRSGWRGWLGGR